MNIKTSKFIQYIIRLLKTFRVYKKCASNGSLAVYVGTRTLTVDGLHLEPLKGVLVLDKDALAQNVSPNFRIWGQITLTFRYGREDEEVLGLRFCNEG
jgi:beta-arrestin